MKNLYKTNPFSKTLKNIDRSFVVFIWLTLFPVLGFSQITYTFTNASATGQNGPTQGMVNAAYLLTNLNGAVTINTTGIQQWVVPNSGAYRIEARGAQGGVAWGMGARMIGDFTLTAGAVLKIIVGQQGGSSNNSHGSGGGGSFVLDNFNTPMVIAGGGGGRGATSTTIQATSHGTVVTAGQSPPGGGPGGINGGGGSAASGTSGGTATLPGANATGDTWCSGGGGFSTNGGQYRISNALNGGRSFFNNALGGDPSSNGTGDAPGGFGGGGGAGDRGAGGGGYSGGGGGTQNNDGGGGGGSYNIGANQANTSGYNSGNGLVIITALCNITTSINVSNPICAGNSATLTTNGISNYAWSNGGTSSSIVVSPTVTTVYTLSATSPSNCTASAAITVSVDNTPTVTAVASASIICLNKPVVLTASGATTYTWTSGITNAAAFTPTASSGYTVTGTNACGSTTAALAVTVNPLPSITASINNPTVCSGATIILNGGGSVGGYTWTAGAPNNSAFVPPGTNNYVVTGVGANSCTNTAVVGVTVLVTPTITPVVTPTAICFGGTANLSAVGATGYTWTPGTNLFASTATVSPAISTTYTLFRTNGACSSTSTVNLVVNALPLVNATASPSQICAGAGINLVVVGPITNTWLPGGFTQSNLTVYPNFSTSYTVTGSNGSCTAQAIVPIVVNSSPVISISTSTNIICQGNSATLTVNGTGPLTYTWGPSGNNGSTEVVSPNSTSIISVSATNTQNCISTLNQLIQVNPLPNMNLTANPSFICVGDQAVLSITQATASTNNNVIYNWSAGGSGPNITVSPTLTTIYNVAGTNTLTGCQNSNSVTLAVYIATFAISSPTAICKGETATLTAAGQPTSYVWSVVSGNNTAPSVTVSPVINTTYTVTGTNGSCSTSSQVPVIVNPIPNVTAVAAKNQICKFEVSTITGNGAASYSWSTGAAVPVISFTLSVTTNYTLTGTDLNGCAKTVTVSQFVATCIGIEDVELNGGGGINVYPNPNNGNFTVSSDVNLTLSVMSSLGQIVDTIQLKENNKNEITFSNLPNGIYFLTGQSNGVKVNKKIIVER